MWLIIPAANVNCATDCFNAVIFFSLVCDLTQISAHAIELPGKVWRKQVLTNRGSDPLAYLTVKIADSYIFFTFLVHTRRSTFLLRFFTENKGLFICLFAALGLSFKAYFEVLNASQENLDWRK